jgi:HEAT repeat protein
MEMVRVLVWKLGDSERVERRYAAEALGKMGSEAMAAVPALEEALKDPDERVRSEAARALELIRGPT